MRVTPEGGMGGMHDDGDDHIGSTSEQSIEADVAPLGRGSIGSTATPLGSQGTPLGREECTPPEEVPRLSCRQRRWMHDWRFLPSPPNFGTESHVERERVDEGSVRRR